MAIPRFRDSNAKIINCAMGILAEDEEDFVTRANAVANFLGVGHKVLMIIDGEDDATVWSRTGVEVPEDEDAEPSGPYYKKGKSIVNAANFNSIVIVGAYIYSPNQAPKTAWVRAVGMKVVSNNPTFGLIKLDED